jgi:hypothetical protein
MYTLFRGRKFRAMIMDVWLCSMVPDSRPLRCMVGDMPYIRYYRRWMFSTTCYPLLSSKSTWLYPRKVMIKCFEKPLPVNEPSPDIATEYTNVIGLLSLLWKNKSRLMRLPSCLCLCEFPFHQLSHFWTNFYETWYVYHSNWAQLNGVLHKPLPSACVSLCVSPIVARQRLGEHDTAATNTHATTEELLNSQFSMRSALHQRKVRD